MVKSQRFVRRSEKVNFMKVGEGSFQRMEGFTAMGEDKNPIEHSRKFVDENSETVDVVGISSGISFTMEQRVNNEVHDVIVNIFENELLGDEANVTIMSVDFTEKSEEITETGEVAYKAKVRTFSVIPGSEGSEDMAYTYDGTFRAKGNSVKGYAVFAEDAPTSELDEATFQEVIA